MVPTTASPMVTKSGMPPAVKIGVKVAAGTGEIRLSPVIKLIRSTPI